MSNYTDPNFNQDYSQGYGDQGGAGDYSAGYDFEAGYDAAPAGEEVAYGDHGPIGQDDQQGYQAQDYAPGYDQQADDQGYAQGYEQGYDPHAYAGLAGDDGAEDEEEMEDGEPEAGPRRKPLVLVAVGLVLVLGGAGYFMMNQSSEGGAGGFDLGSITRMIPFLGPKDSEETLAALQGNAGDVKKAIDAYGRENGRLPSTDSAVSAQLRKLGKDLKNPYKPEEPLLLELGEKPSAPGAIAYSLHGRSYDLVVADIAGQPLAIDGQPFTLSGRLSAAKKGQLAAAKPAAVPAGKAPAQAPAGKPAAKVAAQPKAAADGGKPAAEAKKDGLENFINEKLASPSPNPAAQADSPQVLVRRNQEFDRWRSKGIALIYEQKTVESIAAFKKALALRPGDPSVTRWLSTIQDVIDKHTKAEKEKFEEERAKLAPPVPPPPVNAVPQPGPKSDDAAKIYNELQKQDKVPLLAPPKLDE